MKTIEQKAKKVPAIRFAGFEDEWVEKIFGESFTYLQNNTLSRAELNSESGLAKNIHYGDVLVKFGECIDVAEEKIPFVSDAFVVDKFKNSFLQDGDIVIADTAEDETVGKCTEMQGVNEAILLSGLHTIPSRPKEKYGSKFLGYYLNSSAYHQQLLPLMQGVKVLSISKSALQETNLVIPKDNQEQQKIGSFFSNIDSLISLEQKKYDKLTQVKKSMLEKMFPKEGATVPEIRFANFTGEWEKKKLGDMGTTYTGLSGKTKSDFGHGMGRFVTYMNVFLNPVSDPNRTEAVEIDNTRNTVQHGDVFFTTSSETPEEVGMSSVWLDKTENIYLNSFCFGYRPTENIDPFYLAYMLRSNVVRKKITYLAQGISRYNISKNGVMEIEVPLPNFKEQQKIGSYFSHLDSLISLQQRKLEKLKNIKKSLLEKMFV